MTKNIAEFKDRLQQALDHKGWKAVDLVEVTNVPKGAVSYYLAGKSKPKADRLYIMAQALEVSEVWLLGYDVPMRRSDNQKKNDQLAKLVARLKRDENFYNTVVALSNLTESQYRSIEQLITTFNENL